MTDHNLLTDQNVLADIAENDSDPDVRQVAAEKLTDQKLLADIAQNDSDPDVRQVAAEKLTDQKVLADIAQNDSDPDVRKAAAEKVTDQNLLADIAENASDPDIRKAAAEKTGRPIALLTARGLSFEESGFMSMAHYTFKQAIEKTEEERERLPEDDKPHFFADRNRLAPYEGLIRITSGEEAFHHSEAMKARLFMEQTAGRYNKNRFSGNIPGNLRKEETEIVDSLAALYRHRDKACEEGDTTACRKLEVEIEHDRRKREEFTERLRGEYPEYAAVRYPQPLKASEVALRPGEVLIEYAVTETETIAWLIRDNRILKKIRIDKSRNYLRAVINSYRRMLSDTDRVLKPAFDPEQGNELCKLLISEFIIVPDKELALLPFETLVISYPEKIIYRSYPIGGAVFHTVPGVTYLGDRYSISYYQSASVLTQTRALGKASPGKSSWRWPILCSDRQIPA
ncbi:HEAT repeat domain-containing protein [Desulfococcaceae bacterium HSG8]|nr:HEAT repeat domain-containing protein [Desulfococcaceae bacterium HSG8]